MGAPIYLVSACTSGDEFIAAFRRYADKTGLFIPIAEPLPPGGRSRFAVTLRDGGVMIEGLAEIVSSARVPSVVHGRVGMTLRFIEPDEASRTTLAELEKARLSMRPAPPSIPPRAAEIPSQPRPMPPPAQGRIDAVNALAECVAIGDAAVLGPALPAAPAVPPRAGAKPASAAPTSSMRSRSGTGASDGGGLTPRTMAASSPSAPPPLVMPRPSEARLEPPAVTPRATPQPDRLRSAERRSSPEAAAMISGLSQTMTAVAPVAPIEPGPTSETMIAVPPAPSSGPTSDTMVAAMPPAPPASPAEAAAPSRAAPTPSTPARSSTRPGAATPPSARVAHESISATMIAVPMPAATPPSGPTDLRAAIVVPTGSDDDVSGKTQIHAGAPLAPLGGSSGASPAGPSPAAASSTASSAAPSGVSSVASSAPPSTVSSALPARDRRGGRSGAVPPGELSRTQPGLPPELPGTRAGVPVTVHGLPPILRPPAVALGPEIEIAEPTDISMPPAPPSPSAPLAAEPEPEAELDAAPELDAEAELAPEPELDAEAAERAQARDSALHTRERPAAPGPDAADHRPRRTVIGVAVVPPGVTVVPAKPAPRRPDARDARPVALAPAEDALGLRRALLEDAAAREVSADEDWGPDTPRASPPSPAGRSEPGGKLPSGDWTISLDPSAPDGWSAPFETLAADAIDDAPSDLAAPSGAGRSSTPLSSLAVANPAPVDPASGLASLDPDEEPSGEPKVQIDPTLIGSPVRADGAPDAEASPAAITAGSATALPSYGLGAVLDAVDSPGVPPLPMMVAAAPPPAYAIPHAPPVIPGALPGYPVGPSHPAIAIALPPIGPAAPAGRFVDPRHASDPAQQARSRRRLIILLASAVAAVLLGIVALLVFRNLGEGSAPRHPTSLHPPTSAGAASASAPAGAVDPGPGPGPGPGALPHASAPPAAGDPAGIAGSPTASTAAAPSRLPPEPGAGQPRAAQAGEASAVPPPHPADTCFADIHSQPAGADIVVDQNRVLGKTPQRLALPCGSPIEITLRKPHLVPATRTVTPTPDGPTLQVALARQTFLVKVSSVPEGATITLAGKPLGVTPTVVRVPAFEPSALSIAKAGYEPEIQRVAPRANGVAVRAVLKRAERRKSR